MQKQTWIWICLAAVLSFVSFLFEKGSIKVEESQTDDLSVGIDPDLVSVVDYFYETNKWVHMARTNNEWLLLSPMVYPGNNANITSFVQAFCKLNLERSISEGELQKYKQTPENFGIFPFQNTLVLQTDAGVRTEFRLGQKTVGENEFFFQLMGRDSIYMADTQLLKLIPEIVDGWRDNHVFLCNTNDIKELSFKAPPPYGFALKRRPRPLQPWEIVKPTPSRADGEKVAELLGQFNTWMVQSFVPENVKSDNFGLESPLAELNLILNDDRFYQVQFGNIYPVDTNLTYLRLCEEDRTNIVLAKSEFLENLMHPHQNFKSMHLWDVKTNVIASVVFHSNPGTTNAFSFRLRKVNEKAGDAQSLCWIAEGLSTNSLSGTNRYFADNKTVEWLLKQLEETQIAESVKDIVLDFGEYGLKKPFQEINVATEDLLNQKVLFGNENENGMVFVRYGDESSVSCVTVKDAFKFPTEAFQLSERQITSFTTNDFAQIQFSDAKKTFTIERGLSGKYSISGSQQVISEEVLIVLDELIYRLGELRAESWIYLSEKLPPDFEFEKSPRTLEIQYLVKGNVKTCKLHLTDKRVDGMPIGATQIDGKMWVFKFPPVTYEYYTDLFNLFFRK